MLDLHRLRLLRELKHRGTLAAVAHALDYTPSAISQQLTQLEAEVGVALREPAGRRVRLTPQAEILVAHTEAVLARLERAEAEVGASLAKVSGTVRVAAFQTAVLALAPGALAGLRADHPGLRVELVQVEPDLSRLASREVDLVVDEEYRHLPAQRPPGLRVRELLVDRMRLALPGGVGPPGGTAAAMRRAAGSPWILEPEGTPARTWAQAVCRAFGFEPDVLYETTDVRTHRRFAELGLAAAFLPDLLWGPEGARPGGLYGLPEEWRDRRVVAVVRDGADEHPALAAVLEALRREGGGGPQA
ncbi:LysR substrate-binding domain-containing protein [Nocardiopsis suaedae]|uniref:LysR substrate-binding domain-containing protein n=1 Tax=Nocardiopsis suaedae TaxID=3018444 RepID=A0ABT4TIV6_9ACTN|nr:LysR substrate-binding domain-containing protein [Nocardiopsis suaedae]MDA2804628.1 LysR substrate-binding domain-containing protein [Nocardiopsis suaedae]